MRVNQIFSKQFIIALVVVLSFSLALQASALLLIPACVDGIDNDGDGLIDFPADPGCDSFIDLDEFNPPLPVEPEPVIIIPGITGSWQVAGEWRIDPILHSYDNLWLALQNAGYVVDETLFALPYQWRQSNVITALELRDKIVNVKQVCGCNKVDLVAHSMGGLVARSYIQGIDYDNDVDQIILLGTPNRGSPEAYLQWEAAEGFANNIFGRIQKEFFRLEALKNGYLSLVDYIHDRVVSVEQLLPINDYLRDASTGNLKSYPNNYPRNTFLENLNVDPAITLLKQRVNLNSIIGDFGSNSTLNIIRVVPDPDPGDTKWEHGYPENFDDSSTDQGLEYGSGDGTVPQSSQQGLGSDTNELTVASEHRLLPTNAQQDIIEILTGTRPADFIKASSIKKILFVTIKSPADFYILDPNGLRLGKDFSTGNFFGEISQGFYSGYDVDIEFLTIPNPIDGDYEIILEGTDNGDYEIEVSLIDDENIVTNALSGYITESLIEELNFEFNPESPEPLNIEPEDQEPPVITINSPNTGQTYTRQDTITIDYSVTDETGVLSDQAEFASSPRLVANGEEINLFFEDIGSHELTVVATDYLGNRATSTAQFTLGATFDSLIYDIEKSYELGWIKRRAIKKSLIRRVKRLKRRKPFIQRIILDKALLNILQAFRGAGLINNQAYQVLSSDVEYLLDNL